MGDKSRFPMNLLSKLSDNKLDGKLMREVSKCIMLIDYSDEEYNQDFFSIFIMILDEEIESDTDYDEIEKLYKDRFVDSISEFRSFFNI